MNQSSFNQFSSNPDSAETEPKLFTEMPAPLPPEISTMPSGYAPMSRVELEGKSYRGLVSGDVPWWVLITGAVVLIAPILGLVLMERDWVLLLALSPLLALSIAVVGRGVQKKLTAQKVREKRQARRLRGIRNLER